MKQSMLKKFLAFSLCVMVVVASFAGAVTISAESSVEGYYGTEADGIEAKAYKLLQLEGTDTFRNGDFSEGFKYWGPIDSKGGKASDFAALENGVVTLTGTTAYTDGISSVLFKLPFAAKGDKVVAFASYKADGKARLRLVQRTDGKDVNSGLLPLNNTSDKWVRNRTMSQVVEGDNQEFYITYQLTDAGPVDVSLSNITIIVYKENEVLTVNAATGETVYSENGTSYTGTYKDGIELPASKLLNMPAADNYYIDFKNNGLKYLGGFPNKGGKASDYASVNEKGELSLKSSENYNGVVSLKFKLPGVPVGSKIALGIEYKATDGNACFNMYDANGAAVTAPALPSTNGEWKFIRANSTVAVENGEYYLRFYPFGGSTETLIRNPRIYIYDGTGYLTDAITGEKIIEETGKPVDGTVEDGVEVKSYKFFSLPVNESLKNLDFSEGLKYWGPVNSLGGKASDYAAVTDGALGFKGTANSGVYSRVANIAEVKDGDKIAVFYDYITPNSGDVSVTLSEHSADNAATVVATASTSTYPMAVTETWKTGRTGILTVSSASDAFSVSARQSVDSTSALIKNFRIGVMLENGTFRSLYTDEIFMADGSVYGGTEADGITALSGKFVSIPATDAPLNLDFTQGLKYWGALNGRGGTASDFVTVNEGVVTFKATEGHYGINSLRFSMNNLSVGEGVLAAFDYKATGNDARVTLFGYDSALAETSNAKYDLTPTNGEWVTAVTGAVVKNADTDTFMIDLRQTAASSDAEIKNIRLYKTDKGGLGYVTLDNKLTDENQLGDANNDGVVDIRDIVRIKRYVADNSQPIFYAASKFDSQTDVIGATDLAGLISKIIGI